MELKKIGRIEVKDEPYLKPISDEGIGFYNLDDNTASLLFYVTKNNHPLLVSKENAETYIYLESDNGSNELVEDVEYIDPMNGIVQVDIPIEFLQAATDTTVTGQIYITVNKNNSVDARKSDTAVLTEFSFDVRNARINKLNGGTKISYIKMFDELKKQISDKVSDIEKNLGDLDAYLLKVQTASDYGVTKVKTEVNKGQKNISDLSNKGLKDIQNSLNAALNTIRNQAEDNTTDITTKGDNYLKQLRTEVTNIENILANEGFVKNADYTNDLQALRDKLNEVAPTDSGWVEFDTKNGAVKNKHYKLSGQNGFDCAYRTIKYNTYTEKFVRINADTFKTGTVIATLPKDFASNTHTAFVRAVPTNAGGAQVVLDPSGDLKVWITDTSKWTSDKDSYIYGEFSFIE